MADTGTMAFAKPSVRTTASVRIAMAPRRPLSLLLLLLVAAIALISSCHALYEDQVGVRDWWVFDFSQRSQTLLLRLLLHHHHPRMLAGSVCIIFFLFHRTVSLCNSRQLRDQSRQFKFWYPSIVLMCCEILSYSRAPQRIISNWYANSRNNGDPAAFSSALVIFVDLGFERWRISHVLFFFSSGRRLSDHRLTPYFGCGDV